MKIAFNTTKFSGQPEPYKYNYGNSYINVYLDAGGLLMQTRETDKSDKFHECINFDEQNNVIGYHRYDYIDKNKSVEYYKDKYQEYTRKAHKEQRGDFFHYTEEYICKTNPSSNYVMETISDASGKIIKSIMNGEILLDKLAK